MGHLDEECMSCCSLSIIVCWAKFPNTSYLLNEKQGKVGETLVKTLVIFRSKLKYF